jgi:hypothetical protein
LASICFSTSAFGELGAANAKEEINNKLERKERDKFFIILQRLSY